MEKRRVTGREKRAFQTLVNAETGQTVVPRITVARSLWQQSVGLMGRKELPVASGLWLEPCNGVHTFFMRFPIDLLFLDREGIVIRVLPNVRPWRIPGFVRHARVVVELPAGTLQTAQIATGQHFVLIPNP